MYADEVREAIDRGAIKNGEKKPRSRAPGPASCRKYARKELARALPAIVTAFVKEARNGSVAHARVLTSLSGLDGEPVPPPKQRRTKGFVALLLDEMDREDKVDKRKEENGGQVD